MNKILLHKEVQEFISENYKKDISRIVFQGSPFENISVQELAVQLEGKLKAEKKLPTWFKTQNIIYPPKLNLEQTSSEVTAVYKASLTGGGILMDLTGGFGVDSYFFSKNFQKVIHCELNKELAEMVAHNTELLGATNIVVIPGDGIEILKASNEKIDWIYLDPSRRDTAGGRVFHLSDCLPDVPENLDLLLEKAPNVLVKTSPLLDLQAGILSLKKVAAVHIIAVNNEVKELLWILSRQPSLNVRISTLNFRKKKVEVYENFYRIPSGVEYCLPLTYLYEPNAAIMKSGLFDVLGKDLGLLKLHQNSHLYTSEKLKEFPGRRFEIIQILPYSKKKLKSAFQFDQAHIAIRNFSETVATLRKQFKLKDGGDRYLFFTTVGKDKRVVLLCKKIV